MRKRWRLIAAIAAAAISLVVLGYGTTLALRTYYPPVRDRYELQACDLQDESAQEACIFNVISHELRSGGVSAAEDVFKVAYEEYPAFADSGCHSAAHRIGDMTYFELYLGTQSLDSIDFPQDTDSCGYGFFHGFLEHDIQDHPTPAYLTATCDYLTKRLASRMQDIELTCYHAGGHGFTLAQSEIVPKSEWGDVAAFVDTPAAQCASLSDANATDKEQCYEGIFNIIVNYMTAGSFGFSYDAGHPFSVCFRQKQAIQYACIYEMAQKIDGGSGDNASAMIKLVAAIPDMQERLNAFEVGMAGIIQNTIAQDDYTVAYQQCEPLPDPYYSACVRSIAWALFEHGDPQDEYKKALQFCADPSIAAHGDAEVCYQRVHDEIQRFYTPEKIAAVCSEFPQQYQNICSSTK